MTDLIAIIILFLSLMGMGIIILRKIPVLAELSESGGEEPVARNDFWQKLKEKIKNLLPLKSFSSEIFTQKVLSKIRVLTLKMESKIAARLQKLREKSQKKNLGTDNYWQDLKKPEGKEGNKK